MRTDSMVEKDIWMGMRDLNGPLKYHLTCT